MSGRDEGTPARGRFARTARLAALPTAYAGRTALGLGKRLGSRPAELVAEQVQQRTAEQLFATLGQLKGGAMKMGQALSAMEAVLPEQLAGPYRETLVNLQEAAPPMPAGRVHEQLTTSFGPQWRERFRDFDDRPAAADSIGQVHRATWSDGTPVAVKVQYPGAAEALVADLGMLQGLSPWSKPRFPTSTSASSSPSCASGSSRRSTTPARPTPRPPSPTSTATTPPSSCPRSWPWRARCSSPGGSTALPCRAHRRTRPPRCHPGPDAKAPGPMASARYRPCLPRQELDLRPAKIQHEGELLVGH